MYIILQLMYIYIHKNIYTLQVSLSCGAEDAKRRLDVFLMVFTENQAAAREDCHHQPRGAGPSAAAAGFPVGMGKRWGNGLFEDIQNCVELQNLLVCGHLFWVIPQVRG